MAFPPEPQKNLATVGLGSGSGSGSNDISRRVAMRTQDTSAESSQLVLDVALSSARSAPLRRRRRRGACRAPRAAGRAGRSASLDRRNVGRLYDGGTVGRVEAVELVDDRRSSHSVIK